MSISAQQKAVIRIPMKKYGPKLYDGIPLEEPPRRVWLVPDPEDIMEEERESEKVKQELQYYINIEKRLARALGKLIKFTMGLGVKYRVNKDKYLLAEYKNGENERKSISLGDVLEQLRDQGLILDGKKIMIAKEYG